MKARVRPVDPLRHEVPIVDAAGRPTAQFTRQWMQALRVDVAVGETADTVGGLEEDLGGHAASTTDVHGISDTALLVLTNDPRLSDARTPRPHAPSHIAGGADELTLVSLAGLLPWDRLSDVPIAYDDTDGNLSLGPGDNLILTNDPDTPGQLATVSTPALSVTESASINNLEVFGTFSPLRPLNFTAIGLEEVPPFYVHEGAENQEVLNLWAERASYAEFLNGYDANQLLALENSTGGMNRPLLLHGGHSIEKERGGGQTDLEFWHAANTNSWANMKIAAGTILMNAQSGNSNVLQLFQKFATSFSPLFVGAASDTATASTSPLVDVRTFTGTFPIGGTSTIRFRVLRDGTVQSGAAGFMLAGTRILEADLVLKNVSVPVALVSGLAAIATSGSASDLGSGTLAEERLPANAALWDRANVFSADQTVTGALILERPTPASRSLTSRLSTDGAGFYRWALFADGSLNWGPATSSGYDTNLYRSAIDVLKTDDAFDAASLRVTGYETVARPITSVTQFKSLPTVGSGDSSAAFALSCKPFAANGIRPLTDFMTSAACQLVFLYDGLFGHFGPILTFVTAPPALLVSYGSVGVAAGVGSWNLYYDGAQYVIQNNSGSARFLRIFTIGGA